jgi:predicted small lipoprotein YifL
MRAIVSAILLCVLLGACGSKGALVMPPPPGSEQQPSKSNKQN